MASSSDSKSNKLTELLNSDLGKKVARENKAFFQSWWKTWQEWHRKNEMFLEMIAEERKRQGGY
ncbi:MAG: hypothetical protein ACFE9L_15055 [Candidatus Hodarchaeota archaeon]